MPPAKKKILYIITKSNFGGAQRYVFDLATSLDKNQFEISVALGGSGALKGKLESAGIKTIAVPSLERDISTLKEIKAFLNIYKIIKEVQPDIVHLNSSKAGVLGALACRIYNLPNLLYATRYTLHALIIYTAHGWAFKEKRKPINKKIIEYVSWLTIALSHKTIVVSKDDREKVSRFVFVQPRIILVHNGIDSPIFREGSDARRIINEKTGGKIAGKSFWVASIAELHKNKGLEYAINAFALIKRQEIANNKTASNTAYIIIGGGEEKENLQTMIEREGLTDTVTLAGEYQGASELLKAFDLFLLPSLKEGLPYAILEAGSAGLPIIATNVGGVTEVIEDMKSGIVVKEKRPKEISDALSYLIENEAKRKEFGERILKTVQTEYTLERMVGETAEIYNTL